LLLNALRHQVNLHGYLKLHRQPKLVAYRYQTTAGVNAAHRATAIGCASAIPDDLVAEAARREAQLTHWHADAVETSAATAIILQPLQPLVS